MMIISDFEIEYNSNFWLYMIIFLVNLYFLLEVCIKVMVINFIVMLDGL